MTKPDRDPDDVAAKAAKLADVTRAAQGLPATIEDPATLAKVARIIERRSSVD